MRKKQPEKREVTSTVSALIDDSVTSDWNQTDSSARLSPDLHKTPVGDQHECGPPELSSWPLWRMETVLPRGALKCATHTQQPVHDNPDTDKAKWAILCLRWLEVHSWMVVEEKKPWPATEKSFLDKWKPTETTENAGLKTCLTSGYCI